MTKPKKDRLKELKKEFEANLLDGEKVEDCGGATLLAGDVWIWLINNFKPKESNESK